MARIDRYLQEMINRKASDLHLSVGEPIRMRIHGELEPVSDAPLSASQLDALISQICREEQWVEFQSEMDLDFAYGIRGLCRFRCNYFCNQRGHAAVFRVIPERIMTLDELAMPKSLTKLAYIRSGLVLVTGPTGSGKSTTLAALIDEINRNDTRHIITVEDPVEFVHTNKKSFIVQREVGAHAPDFASALQDALREDPDVILVGEMRDLETISLAIKAAEMGVLVFGTLHTNSAAKTLDRIIDVFPPNQQDQVRSMLAESLKAVASQQLMKTKDGKGRVAACEILSEGPGLSALIREGAVQKINSFIQTHRNLGMQNMDWALLQLVQSGVVEADDAMKQSISKEGFAEMLKQAGVRAPQAG